MPFPDRQRDQHFLITGAGTGIGRALALRLAEEGARVSLVARTVSRLEETAALARAAGAASVSVHGADISDQQAITAAVDAAVAAHGPLRGVLANAGIGGPNAPGDGDRFDRIVATNLNGTYYTVRAAEPHLTAAGTRHVVLTSSILGRFGVPGYTGYCASKTALIGLARALALEWADRDVQVNAVCPGWVETDMAWEGIDGMAQGMGISREEAFQQAMSAVPLGRMSQPRDIAGMVAWLVSDDARGVTGQALDMNGGAWMG
jgi:NAD(P)-dependent dehydrogenase (short-subunit alcohol dehydrogenase family)